MRRKHSKRTNNRKIQTDDWKKCPQTDDMNSVSQSALISNSPNRSDLIETFKIINDCYNLNSDLFFTHDEGQRRGHSKKLYKKRSRLDLRKYAFKQQSS